MSFFTRKDPALELIAKTIHEELGALMPTPEGGYTAAPELLRGDLQMVAAVVRGAIAHRDAGMPMDWEFAQAVDRLRGRPPV